MARTRTTIRRIDPWSVLKFGFVANLVLLGIQLLAGAVVWYVVQRLELIQTVCELAATVGFEECGVDGGALFDTFLVLGLLGVVIQTGILVFLTFLANLIFDLTGGIVLTLEDDRRPAGTVRGAGVGARSSGTSGWRRPSRTGVGATSARGGSTSDDPDADATERSDRASDTAQISFGPDDDTTSGASTGAAAGDDDKLFGKS